MHHLPVGAQSANRAPNARATGSFGSLFPPGDRKLLPFPTKGFPMPALLVLAAVALALVLWFVSAYNGLVRLRNGVDNAWAQVDVQLKRRYDLIPNLIETVKGYMTHERETLESVVRARSAALAASGPAQAAQADSAVSGALRAIMVNVERYPQLKANENFLSLQEELASTENKVSFARQAYNDAATRFNSLIQTIPTNIVAGLAHFAPRDLFKTESAEERAAPKVSFQ